MSSRAPKPAGQSAAFERLRSKFPGPLRPVKPLRPGWIRAMGLLPYVLVAVTLIVGFGLRPDARLLGPEVLWGVSAIQLLVAYLLFALVLRHSTPGHEFAAPVGFGLPVLVLGIQLSSAWLGFSRSPSTVPPELTVRFGLICLGSMALLGFVPLVVVLWLLSRGLPLRPRIAGLLAGFGGGLAAEAIYRFHCPYSALGHVVAWHVPGVLALGLVGAGVGVVWEARRLRHWEKELLTSTPRG